MLSEFSVEYVLAIAHRLSLSNIVHLKDKDCNEKEMLLCFVQYPLAFECTSKVQETIVWTSKYWTANIWT